MGLWHAIDRAVTKDHDNGKLAVICTGNWTENEQEWASLQFISTVAVVKFIYVIYVELEFIVFLIGSGSQVGKCAGAKSVVEKIRVRDGEN